jgi:phosphomevalonate kinase
VTRASAAVAPAGTRAVTRHAPGKLFIAGEYAVVEPGRPAIVVAVDRTVSVTAAVVPSDGADAVADVEIVSDLSPQGARLWRHGGRLAGRGPDSERLAGGGLAHVVSAVEVLTRLLAEQGREIPALHLSVTSRLHEAGTKFGLGSSGAVTVATVAALGDLFGLHLSPETRFRLAVLATGRLDPNASCGDLAASTWGGWLAYRAPDRAAVLKLALRAGIAETVRAPWPDFAVRRLPPPARLALQVGWTGTPASTGALVSKLDSWRDGPVYREFLARSAECVRACENALERGEDRELLAAIRDARLLLAGLDREAGLGIGTDRLTALCDAAEAEGGAAKPSGAGGGDCGIALIKTTGPGGAARLARLRERWAAAGIRPLPLHVQLTEGVGE